MDDAQLGRLGGRGAWQGARLRVSHGDIAAGTARRDAPAGHCSSAAAFSAAAEAVSSIVTLSSGTGRSGPMSLIVAIGSLRPGGRPKGAPSPLAVNKGSRLSSRTESGVCKPRALRSFLGRYALRSSTSKGRKTRASVLLEIVIPLPWLGVS